MTHYPFIKKSLNWLAMLGVTAHLPLDAPAFRGPIDKIHHVRAVLPP
jgi:hypothetical protein